MEADLLGRVQRRGADAEHDLDAGHGGGDELAPLALTACAMASAGNATVAPGCTPVPGLRKLSNSKACASAPSASAACGTWNVLPATPGTRHGPPAPLAAASASTILDQGNCWPKITQRDGVDQAMLGALDDRLRQVPRTRSVAA